MFFIAGVQSKKARLEGHDRRCPNCNANTLQLTRMDNYISLFFIPVIPIKRGEPFLLCRTCDAAYAADMGGGTMNDMQYDEPQGRTCGSCNKQVAGDFSYCPYCGKSIT